MTSFLDGVALIPELPRSSRVPSLYRCGRRQEMTPSAHYHRRLGNRRLGDTPKRVRGGILTPLCRYLRGNLRQRRLYVGKGPAGERAAAEDAKQLAAQEAELRAWQSALGEMASATAAVDSLAAAY